MPQRVLPRYPKTPNSNLETVRTRFQLRDIQALRIVGEAAWDEHAIELLHSSARHVAQQFESEVWIIGIDL